MIMLALGTLSSLGYGPLAGVKLIGMQFLDFFDFLTNSVMMPVAAIATCLLVSRVIGVGKIEQEVLSGETTFRRKKIFNFMIRFLCPVFAVIILLELHRQRLWLDLDVILAAIEKAPSPRLSSGETRALFRCTRQATAGTAPERAAGQEGR